MPDLFSFDERSTSMENVEEVSCRVALTPSRLPGLAYALNPYVGCEHGCVYCYSPYLIGADRRWGSFVRARSNMPLLLARELRKKEGIIGIGTVTDPYQPVEVSTRLTRKCLEVMQRHDARVSIHTKSDFVTRDIPVLRQMGEVEVGVTITTIDDHLASQFEPGAPSPSRRIAALRRLIDEGIDAYVLIGPIIPLVTERRMEELVDSLREAGVRRAMLDRLRLRPGMMDTIGRVEMMRDPVLRSDFLQAVSALSCQEVIGRNLKKALLERGIRCEDAF